MMTHGRSGYREPVTAVFFGLATAVAWAVTSLCSARASRMIGAAPTLALVSLIGLVISAPLAVLDSRAGVDPVDIGWLALAGLGNVLGLLLLYAAVRRGKVGIAAPIASTEGAIAALIAVLLGEAIAPQAVVAMAVIVIGVILATLDLSRSGDIEPSVSPSFLALVIPVALLFGIGLYAGGRVSESVPAGWLIASARVVGVLLITIPLLIRGRGRLPSPRAALPWIVVTAAGEVFGYGTYILGARDSISITAVLASQFAAITAVGAYVFLGERLARVQRVGVAMVCAGAAALAIVQTSG